MNLSEQCIRRPVATTLLWLAVAAGIFGTGVCLLLDPIMRLSGRCPERAFCSGISDAAAGPRPPPR